MMISTKRLLWSLLLPVFVFVLVCVLWLHSAKSDGYRSIGLFVNGSRNRQQTALSTGKRFINLISAGFIPLTGRNETLQDSAMTDPAAAKRVESVLNNESEINTICSPTSTTNTTTSDRLPRLHYVIEWLHWEQMTMAMQSFIQLGWFVADWRTVLVEPFTRNGYFYGLNNAHHSAHPISAIFNMTLFNRTLFKHSLPPVVSFDSFVQSRVTKVFFIHVFFHKNDVGSFDKLNGKRQLVWDLFHQQKNNVVMCGNTAYMKDISYQFIHSINNVLRVRQGTYKSVGSCCIKNNMAGGIDRKEVMNKCGIANLKEKHVIVFTDWRGVSDATSFRFLSSEHCSLASVPRPTKMVYPFSNRIRSEAAAFLHRMSNNGNSPVIAIHFRSEKLASVDETTPGYFDGCVRKSVELKNSILLNKTQQFTVLTITDVSKHGSRSCKKHCFGKTLMEKAVSKYNLKTISYNPIRFHGLPDSTFVAAVEQEAMSMVDSLILVGGGSFQTQLRLRYQVYHGKRSKPYQICTK